jgi:serine/threonine protein phosphatase PrpC
MNDRSDRTPKACARALGNHGGKAAPRASFAGTLRCVVYRSGPQPTRLAIAALTHAGSKRKGNLDGYLATDFERCVAREPYPFFAEVAGLSGVAFAVLSGHLLDWSRDLANVERAAAAGFTMSRVAGDILLDQLVGQPPARSDTGLRERLLQSLGNAARGVYAAAPDRRFVDTAASISLAVIQNEQLSLVQAGDTRALLLRGNHLARLHLGETFEGGVIGTGFRAGLPQNPAARALGAPVPVEPGVVSSSLFPGDTLLLCSRGLASLDDRTLFGILSAKPHPGEACKALIEAALRARGEHNLTALVARPIDDRQRG